MPRGKNLRPVSTAITPSAGRWHGFVTVGTKVDGKPDRTHRTAVMCASCKVAPDVTCVCYRRCEDKIRRLEDNLAAGVPEQRGTPLGVAQLAAKWLEDCEDRGLKYGTMTSYRATLRNYITGPGQVGGLRLHQLDEDRIKKRLKEVKAAVSPQAARKTLRVLRLLLGYAERKKLGVMRNAAKFVPMPALDGKSEEPEALMAEEVRKVLPVIMRRRNKARWLLALVHGPRQGECLGLAYHRPDEPRVGSDVDTVAGTVRKRKKIERRKWLHGCADPHACGGAPRPKRPNGHHKLKPCRQPCNRHTRTCPPPCARDCTTHASACPDRHGGGLVVDDPKAKASKHTIALDPVVNQAFIDHETQRAADKAAAGSKWVETGFVFTTPFGQPIDPKRDWDEWQSILTEAGLPAARVHALRHTAATNLVVAGVDPRVRREIMGWAQDMPVYEHIASALQKDAIAKVGAMLWSDPTASRQPEPDPTEPDSATTVLPDDHSNVIPFRRRAA